MIELQKEQVNDRRIDIFNSQIASLEPAPEGFEYKGFMKRRVLFPETGNDPIINGTGYTERQLRVALILQRCKDADPESFNDLLESRDRRIRRDEILQTLARAR